jgi:hypothetical protein
MCQNNNNKNNQCCGNCHCNDEQPMTAEEALEGAMEELDQNDVVFEDTAKILLELLENCEMSEEVAEGLYFALENLGYSVEQNETEEENIDDEVPPFNSITYIVENVQQIVPMTVKKQVSEWASKLKSNFNSYLLSK